MMISRVRKLCETRMIAPTAKGLPRLWMATERSLRRGARARRTSSGGASRGGRRGGTGGAEKSIAPGDSGQILEGGIFANDMHTVKDRAKLIGRVRRIRGQIEAVERALLEEKGCYDVLQTVAAARGALNGLVAEMIEDHVRFHVLDPEEKVSAKRARAADELINVVRAYVK